MVAVLSGRRALPTQFFPRHHANWRSVETRPHLIQPQQSKHAGSLTIPLAGCEDRFAEMGDLSSKPIQFQAAPAIKRGSIGPTAEFSRAYPPLPQSLPLWLRNRKTR